jgi:hypothetical protein
MLFALILVSIVAVFLFFAYRAASVRADRLEYENDRVHDEINEMYSTNLRLIKRNKKAVNIIDRLKADNYELLHAAKKRNNARR